MVITDLGKEANLTEAVKNQRAVLFLGAGAAYGANDGKGNCIPLAAELGAMLAKEFLSEEYTEEPFVNIYDYSCSRRDVRTVQKFVHDELLKHKPADYHALIPTFPWQAICTTNYDLVIERSYNLAEDRVGEVVPVSIDDEYSEQAFSTTKIPYIKLHGCITKYTQINPPLVASTEQIIRHREGRSGLFDTFLELSRTKTIIFAGYNMQDPNLRALLDILIKEGDSRPRHYIVDPFIKDLAAEYWIERRIWPIKLSFEEFLKHLDALLPKEQRQLLTAISMPETTAFTKKISVHGRFESTQLKTLIASGAYVSVDMELKECDAQRFYSGFDCGWYPFKHSYDVRRNIVDNLLSRVITQRSAANGTNFYLLKAYAGAGKTVTLRRVAWEAATNHDKAIFYFDISTPLNIEVFEEVISLTNERIFLFVDDLADRVQEVKDFLTISSKQNWPITIIGAERNNEWNIYCDDLEPFLNNTYELRGLSESEIAELLLKLEKYKCLGELEAKTHEERKKAFKEVFGRELLIALHEATKGKRFQDIAADEYNAILPEEAKILYRDICTLHQFGPPVRAGLISRVHKISFEQFEEEFFLPLEKVVRLRKDMRTGDYVYEARHAYIANLVFLNVYDSTDELLDSLLRIITKLNPVYSYDQKVILTILKAGNMISSNFNLVQCRALFDAAYAHLGRTVPVLHQHGIIEMKFAEKESEFDIAEELFEEALAVDHRNSTVKHSLAELALSRSRVSRNDAEKAAFRSKAAALASDLIPNKGSSHPHHTLIKIKLDNLKDVLRKLRHSENELTLQSAEDAIGDVEKTIATAKDKYPNDEHILNEEAELAKVLQESDRVRAVLEKAWEARPQSKLVASKLARVYITNGETDKALSVLGKAVQHNPADKDLHFKLAQAYMAKSPEADMVDSENILHHLNLAFRPRDPDFEAKFWYARQLCLMKRYSEAKPLFEELKALKIPYRDRAFVQGKVRDKSGDDRWLQAEVVRSTATYTLVDVPELQLRAFMPNELIEQNSQLQNKESLEIIIGFNFFGPVVCNVRRLLV
ncbi:MAG: SIR2 family protein [Alphaproteobacteria bacterium]|nr:SIR2 family protein [Alphaproteobacteria bacterium]